MPAIFRAHGALPQWIGERLLSPPCTIVFHRKVSLRCHEQALIKNAVRCLPTDRAGYRDGARRLAR